MNVARIAAACTAMGLLVGGCGQSSRDTDVGNPDDSRSTAQAAGGDCEVLVKYGGAVYVYQGEDDVKLVERLGVGKMSTCSDTGPDARGAVFTENSQSVEVWSIKGVDTQVAVGLAAESENGEPSTLLAQDATAREAVRLRSAGTSR